jgi:hypothetical protein
MMFAISVESRFPRPFGFGHTPFSGARSRES